MAPSVVYETVCPACSRPFDLPAGASEGNCPHCKAYLRFVEEEPAPEPAPSMPGPGDASAPPPAPAESAATDATPAAPAPLEVPPPRIGEFRVNCAACHRGFNVDAAATTSTCPHCLTPLLLEDEFAERGIEFPVQCPGCQTLHEVPLDTMQGTCPHCNARLEYENQYVERAALASPEPAMKETPAPAPEPAAAAAEPLPDSRAEEPKRKAKETPAVEPEPEPPRIPDVPVARTDRDGLPLTVDCPSCKKAFAIPKDSHEGNCPHCNVPLAFISEKEYNALLEAEERKKQFQAKLAARRQAKKAKEQAKREKDAETQGGTPAPAAPVPPVIARSSARPEQSKMVAAEAPQAPGGVVATPPAAEGKKSRFAFLRRGKKDEPAPTAPIVETADFVMDSSPDTAKPASKKPSKPPPTEAAVVEMEPFSLDAPATIEPPAPAKKPRGKAAPPTEVSPDLDVSIDEIPALPAPKKASKAKAAPVDAPAEIEFSMGDATATPAVPSSAEAPSKKSLFGRFKKNKTEAAAPAAVVEMGDVSFDATPAPSAPTKTRKKERPTPAPAPVEMGEISFAADAPAAEPAAKPRKGKAAPAPMAAIEMGEVSIDSGPPPAAEAEISIDMGASADAPAKKRKR